MTETSATDPRREKTAAAAQAPRNPARRRLLLGGIPVAVTLASRPALAAGQCSLSNALSGNLSHPLPSGVNCGLTPATWVTLAGTDQLWPRTGMTPQTRFSTAAGAPGFGSDWTCGTQSLLSALQGSLVIECKINGRSPAVKLNAQLFGEQIAAALLNAAAFGPNNYTTTLSQIEALVQAIWTTSPKSKTQAQLELDAVSNELATLNSNS